MRKLKFNQLRRSLLISFGAALPLANSGLLFAKQNAELRWGSATLGSTGYVIIETFTHIVNKYTDTKNSALATSGTTENIVLLNEGLLDLGQSASVDWGPAIKGQEPFQEPTKAQQMFSYTTWNMPPIVRASSEMQTIYDLEGKRASPGAAGASTRAIWEPIFESSNLQDKINWSYGSWREIYDAFKAGSIDCVPGLMVNGAPSPIFEELMMSVDVKVLEIPEEIIEKAKKINAGINVISASESKLNIEDLNADILLPGSSGILAAHPSLDDEVAYQITKSIFENEKEAKSISKELNGLNIDEATRFLVQGVPVNKGAARYFKEQNVWRDELTISN